MALDDAWKDRGKCRELDPVEADRLFFPPKERGVKTDYSEARKICETCPVRVQCLSYAIAHNVPEGVWGAKSPNERRAIDKAMKVQMRKLWWRIHPLSRPTR